MSPAANDSGGSQEPGKPHVKEVVCGDFIQFSINGVGKGTVPIEFAAKYRLILADAISDKGAVPQSET